MTDWHLAQTFASPQGEIRWDAFGAGSPVVLLHGTPNWSFIWRHVVDQLVPHHRGYVFDWPGFGRSQRFPGQNISWDEQARRLAAAIPGAELRFIPDAGHFSPEDNPAAFAEEIVAFQQELGH